MAENSENEKGCDASALFSSLPPQKRVDVGYRYIYETEKPKEITNIHYVLFGTLSNKEESKEIMQSIVDVFEEKCAGLKNYPEAIRRVELSVYVANSESSVAKTYGWNINVLINITIKVDAKLPESLDCCAGDTLLYTVGGGNKAGILIVGDAAALFFGLGVGSLLLGKMLLLRIVRFRLWIR